MARVLTRIIISFVIAVMIVLIAAVATAKLVSLMRGPHEAAADLESAIGVYWPLIIVAIAALTVGLWVAGGGRASPSDSWVANTSGRGAAPDAEGCGYSGHWLEGANREHRAQCVRLVEAAQPSSSMTAVADQCHHAAAVVHQAVSQA